MSSRALVGHAAAELKAVRSEIGAEKNDGRSEQMDARYVLRVLGEEGEAQWRRQGG